MATAAAHSARLAELEFISVNGVRIASADTGGTGIPLALVHGSWGSHRNWDPVVPGLTEHFRVVAYDRRGHSDSERPPGQGHQEALSALTGSPGARVDYNRQRGRAPPTTRPSARSPTGSSGSSTAAWVIRYDENTAGSTSKSKPPPLDNLQPWDSRLNPPVHRHSPLGCQRVRRSAEPASTETSRARC